MAPLELNIGPEYTAYVVDANGKALSTLEKHVVASSGNIVSLVVGIVQGGLLDDRECLTVQGYPFCGGVVNGQYLYPGNIVEVGGVKIESTWR